MEVERARLTKVLSNLKEEKGLILEAADILQELQVIISIFTKGGDLWINGKKGKNGIYS